MSQCSHVNIQGVADKPHPSFNVARAGKVQGGIGETFVKRNHNCIQFHDRVCGGPLLAVGFFYIDLVS